MTGALCNVHLFHNQWSHLLRVTGVTQVEIHFRDVVGVVFAGSRFGLLGEAGGGGSACRCSLKGVGALKRVGALCLVARSGTPSNHNQ